jgi:hypothetical protein
MIFFRILAAFLAVAKLLLGFLFIVVAWANAVHAFGAGGYEPPDWRLGHIVLILAAIALAYPHSLFRSRILSLLVIALSAMSTIALVFDPEYGKTPVLSLVFFLLVVGEWLLQRYAFADRTKLPTPALDDPRASHSERREESPRLPKRPSQPPATQKRRQEKKQNRDNNQ